MIEILKEKAWLVLAIYIVIIIAFLISTHKTKKIADPIERKKRKRKENIFLKVIASSYLLFVIALGNYKTAIALLIILVIENEFTIANLNNTIEYYESKEYNDWMRNIPNSEKED